ncbi:hypothetical protein LTR94_025537 [Friedmanniomyces endolithicus]|nr:hypothetical protein LTR94_025537 [Friedmanniomyces endolithicus]
MAPYVAICTAMMTTDAFDDLIGKPAGWVLAMALSAPVIGQLWATLSLMRESDEFLRGVMAKQVIVTTGLTMAVAVFWGFGETLAGAPHLPSWLIYPLFWAIFGGRGWTQEQLGQALGVSRQAVIALETERHDPSLDLAYRIAAAFGRPVEEIFENAHASD